MTKLLITLGPASLKKDVIEKMDQYGVFLFRINLSHTPIDKLEETITTLIKYTNTPICLDSEGAQIRNRRMQNGEVIFRKEKAFASFLRKRWKSPEIFV